MGAEWRAYTFALCVVLGCGRVTEEKGDVPSSDGGSSGLGTGGASGGGGASVAGMRSAGGAEAAGGGSAGRGTGGGGEGGVARGGTGGDSNAGSGGMEVGGEGGAGADGASGGAEVGGAAGFAGSSGAGQAGGAGTAQAGSGGMTCVPLGPPAGATILHSFDVDTEGFHWNTTQPGDPTYVVVTNAQVSWDAGLGADCLPGRLKLTIPFTNWNQLANIEVAFAAPRDLLGDILRARVLFELGGSENPSCPPGCYLYVLTGDEAVWAKGIDINLERANAGTWSTVPFNIDSPTQANSPYDPADTRTLGMQVYSSSGSGCQELPTELVVYLDDISFEPTI